MNDNDDERITDGGETMRENTPTDITDRQATEEDSEYSKVWMNESNGDISSSPADIDVKSEWGSVTVYLPESLRNELELTYRKLGYEYKQSHGRDLQKLRDFYPLVFAMGLETLESTDSEDALSVLDFILEDHE